MLLVSYWLVIGWDGIDGKIFLLLISPSPRLPTPYLPVPYFQCEMSSLGRSGKVKIVCCSSDVGNSSGKYSRRAKIIAPTIAISNKTEANSKGSKKSVKKCSPITTMEF